MAVLPNPGDEFGEYHIVEVLGTGGMGVVYTAVQRRLNRTVALKVLSLRFMEDPEQRARFVHEATVLSQVDSPHITHIYDTGEVNGCLFIATQLIRGGDLGDLLRRGVPLGVDMALDVTMQIASALEDAHRVGVIHRDVKPSNVLLRDGIETYAYLCDFGIARSNSSVQTTATGHVTGTWAYLAPERINGASATARTDIYSLGCLLWAALTGEAPYQGSNEVHVAFQHTTAPIPQLVDEGEVERRLNAVLVRSMAKRPEHRYERAGHMRADLATVAELVARPSGGTGNDTMLRPSLDLPRSLIPTPPPGQDTTDLRARRSRRGVAAVVVSALLLTAAGTLGTVWISKGDGQESTTGATTSPGPSKSSGSSSPKGSTRSTVAETRELTRVSYDGDDLSDVAIQEFDKNGVVGPSEVVVLRSNGTALEQPQLWRTLTASEPFTKHRFNGDFNGDGQTDAAVAVDGAAGTTMNVLRSNGTGFDDLELWGGLNNGENSEQIVPISGDYEGDGDADVLVSFVADPVNGQTMRLSVLRSNGKDSFGKPENWAERPWNRKGTKLVPGDLNADGRTDLLVVRRGPGTIICSSLVSNSRRFVADVPLKTVEDSNWDNVKPMVGDFDGDDVTDVLVFHDAPEGGVETLFLKGDKTGLREPVRWWQNEDWRADESWVSVGDFNDDGLDDVARIAPTTSQSGVDVWVLTSTGSSLQSGERPWGSWPVERTFGQTRTLNRIG